ncbi:hypothetical protein lpari_03158 [Legionella parisiensis]|uniref:Effector protein B, substrate of the Dot/Icm secretion system n=2 Tax=Legionella parisiensis TaxID=45071 RepID=A0A1E5JMT1_9GAMM|nr:LepB GTPase-activating domain-containing protein [Legionella parisiensis]OEH45839.1 hypothetical protein lpari_03158 [Legionella parisiensis]
MLGLEQSAPAASPLAFVWGAEKYPEDVQQNHDQFGQGHSLTGASDTYTAAGSLYFSDPVYQAKLLLEKGVFPPDKYGAMQVKVTDENWPKIKEFLELLRAQSDEINKEQLLELLLTKPSTAKPAKDEYKSYIALDFQSYLKRVYQVFISEAELDTESQLRFLALQTNLSVTIKKLQQGQIENYELFKEQIKEMIGIKNIPPEYRKAIIRIQQLFELQIEIDPQLNQTHQELLLRNQYDDLQEESKIILEKLAEIKRHFREQPPTKEQIELQAFLLQLDMQIMELENPFASKEPVDLESSWVMCTIPISINTESIEKLRQTIERAKELTRQSPLKGREGVSFPQVLSGWQEKLLPLSQINLIDYTELNLNDLAKQFNEYIVFLAQQAETLNLWEHDSSQTTNLLVEYSDKNSKLYGGYAFVAQYRESTILRNLFSLDQSTLGTLRFMPYEAPAARYSEQFPESYWSKVTALLTAGADVIAMLRTLQNLQALNSSWEDMSRTATSLKEAMERFEKAREAVAKHPAKISEEAPKVVFESPFFYPISDEALKTMNGVQLATICLEELNAKTPSILVKRITSNQEFWQCMNLALETEQVDFKRRKENVTQKIAVLHQIRHFWELVDQFKESSVLQTKERFLGEMQLLSQECPLIFSANEVIKEAQAEFMQLQEFLLLLHNLVEEPDQYRALQVLEQEYQKLTENERKSYKPQLIDEKKRVCQFYLDKINASETMEEKRENFALFSQLFDKLPVQSKEIFKAEYDVKQKEDSLFALHSHLAQASSVAAKQQVFENKSFSTIIENFSGLSNKVTSECAKKVHKQTTRTKAIYETLLGDNAIKLEDQSDRVDTLLKELETVLDSIIDSNLQSQLIDASLHDETFKQAILKKVEANSKEEAHTKFTSELIQDLLSLKKFRDQKINLSKEKNYDSDYDQSVNQFYGKALDIRLSSDPLQKQVKDILDTANTEFSHRNDRLRFVADVAMVVSAFALVGIFIGLGRLALGKTLFFSDAKTDREEELKDKWIVKDLPKDESDVCIITAPAA